VGELGKFLMNGGLYKGSKAVLWSVVEKTALAEAEIEYHDHVSDTVHVRFPVVKSKDGKLDGTSVVIWTTTPWTMPGNRALAYGKDIAYALVEVAAAEEGSKAVVGEKMVLAKDLVGVVGEAATFRPTSSRV
jgi:isoleucyl-tRNA synthetase